jgi:hypothetical protein
VVGAFAHVSVVTVVTVLAVVDAAADAIRMRGRRRGEHQTRGERENGKREVSTRHVGPLIEG